MRQTESRAIAPSAAALVGLTVIGDHEHAPHLARPTPRPRRRCLPAALGVAPSTAARSAAQRAAPSPSGASLASDDHRVTLDHRPETPLPSGTLENVLDATAAIRRQPASRHLAIGVCDRMLRRDPRARRRGAAARRDRRRARRPRCRPAPCVPVVTVPVLSSTTVSTVRVDSSTSGPLIRMPSCAPRPVPTSSAVGVARPRAQGHAMIEHRDGGGERRRPRVEAERRATPTSVDERRSASTMGTKTPEIRSARRCTSALPDCACFDEVRHLCELGVVAHSAWRAPPGARRH